MHITDTLPHASLRRATPIPEICQKCDRFAAFAGASAKYLGERKGELTKKRGDELPHSEVKLINPATGAVLLCEERGELCCRGYQVMAGYYKMPEQTHAAIDSEGWLHTGDLAMMNVQGSLIIVGRLKEMVIRGENIFPREVEEFLLRLPKVADVCVVGVPDAFFGEELLAVVRPKEGADFTEQDLREFYNVSSIKGRLAIRRFRATSSLWTPIL